MAGEDVLDLISDGYRLIRETVDKWGHNGDCDCERCRWLRKAQPMAEMPIKD